MPLQLFLYLVSANLLNDKIIPFYEKHETEIVSRC